MSGQAFTWQPATKAQKDALDSVADILLFGGSAGSLKTETMLVDACQEHANPNLNAIIFRSSFTQVTDLVRKSRRLYAPLGGKFNGSTYTWKFPSGAVIKFAYLRNDDDVWAHLGPEYTFIGFDESTLHSEFQVRNIIGRLRSTDPTLRLRVRLTSNPGNIGAAWHTDLFLRGHCPVHKPKDSAKPGKLYRDCVWPSDGIPIPMSVAFIPGRLSDHNLLGSDYMQKLRMMSGSHAEAMATGCFCALEGAYFPFLRPEMAVPLETVEVQPWFSHFIAVDYGFGKSYAAAGLFVRGPSEKRTKISIPGVRMEEIEGERPIFENGRISLIDELCEPMMPVHEFAQLVVERFVAPMNGQQARSIVAVFADPANFNPAYDIRAGTSGHSVSDQMDEVMAPFGLVCQRASNQRVAGWQLLYKMLSSGEFQITTEGKKTLSALRTRMIDPDISGDLIKVKGDPDDDRSDCCRYGIMSWINPAEKPKELRLAEAISGIDHSTREGMTSRALRYQQMAEVLEAEEAPVQLTRFSPSRFGRRR